MQKLSNYLELVKNRGQQGKKLNRIYRWIRNPQTLLMAYMNLYPNKGVITPGTNKKDSIDGMSQERIYELSEKLKNGTFEWTPCTRRYIKKKNGSRRPLGIPNWTDKVVAEAMRIILAAYYEPQFSNLSHGFRNGRGCHTALSQILNSGLWKGTKWFIEGDIKGCFDNINHDKLLSILDSKIQDTRFKWLMKGLLKAGYIENWKFNQTWSGTPQGGIVSPLLANIYLNELDNFVKVVLIPEYTKGKTRKFYGEYKSLSKKIQRLEKKGDVEEAIRTKKLRDKLPSIDPYDEDFRRLTYIRYADDFLLSFQGPKKEAEVIKEKLKEFIGEKLKMELSDEKTLITHAETGKARFLRHEINMPIVNSKKVKNKDGKKTRAINRLPTLWIPTDILVKWIDKYSTKYQPVRRPELLNDSVYDIIMTYNLELRGITNFYKSTLNVFKLWTVKGMAYWSLVHTLASKLKTSTRNIIAKYGINRNGIKCIQEVIPSEGLTPLISCFGNVDISYNRNPMEIPDFIVKVQPSRTQLSARLLKNECELCGSKERTEVHHISKMKNLHNKWKGKKEKPLWVQRMIAIKRKTLVVCKKCHTSIHNGSYNGKKLTESN
jgi:group II intron reverse transcriptase/maturase